MKDWRNEMSHWIVTQEMMDKCIAEFGQYYAHANAKRIEPVPDWTERPGTWQSTKDEINDLRAMLEGPK
jgi:hypothetical protein